MTSEELKTLTAKARVIGKEAAVWAFAAALTLELGCNVFNRHTIWHRIDQLETQVKALEHTREMEEQRTRLRLDELQQRADTNKQELKEVEQEVKKK